jgi:hypothetical protein
MDESPWCEDRCGSWSSWVGNAVASTDWEAQDCYRECLGLPPAPPPWWVRGGRKAGHRIAAAAYARTGSQAAALIGVLHLALALARVLGLIVLGLTVLGVALNLIAGA